MQRDGGVKASKCEKWSKLENTAAHRGVMRNMTDGSNHP